MKLNENRQEPIAIVGMGMSLHLESASFGADFLLACRSPGEAVSPSDLWDLLAQGKSAHSDIAPNCLKVDSGYQPDAQRPGSISTRGGYFIS